MLKRPIWLLLLLLFVLPVSVSAQDADDEASLQILFTAAHHNGDAVLANVDVNGENVHVISSELELYQYPRLTPDGDHIVFVGRTAEEAPRIYQVDTDGSNLQAITDDELQYQSISWLPDGTLVADAREGDHWRLYTVDVNSGERRLFVDEDARFPDISANGNHMVYVSGAELVMLELETNTRAVLYESDSDFAMLQPAWSPDGSQIAFIDYSHTTILNVDTLEISRLPGTLRAEVSPRWSPDGSYLVYGRGDRNFAELYAYHFEEEIALRITDEAYYPGTVEWVSAYVERHQLNTQQPQIVYSSMRSDGRINIYRMYADGSNTEQLTDDLVAMMPTVSPDGQYIAYTGAAGPTTQDLYVLSKDGSEFGRITQFEDAGGAYFARWSPDGRYIAFHGRSSDASQTADVFLVEVDTGELTNLTDSPSFDSNPEWSPNGKRLLFKSNRDGAYELYSMRVDGTDIQAVVPSLPMAGASTPSWSPDGTSVAVTVDFSGVRSIVNLDIATRGYILLTDFGVNGLLPDYSSDGQQILFTSYQQGVADILVINADGTDRRIILADGNINESPVWVPVIEEEDTEE